MRSDKGFTLVELLVAISIIAVLSAILLPNFMGARERARDAKKRQDLASMKNALRSYYNDSQSYPVANSWTAVNPSAGIGLTLQPYMPGITGLGYTYEYQGTSDTFMLRVQTDVVNSPDNAVSQANCGIDVGSTMPGYFVVCAN